jgi:hypothetical protein
VAGLRAVVSGHKAGVAGVYNRATYLPEKTEHLLGVVGKHVTPRGVTFESENEWNDRNEKRLPVGAASYSRTIHEHVIIRPSPIVVQACRSSPKSTAPTSQAPQP